MLSNVPEDILYEISKHLDNDSIIRLSMVSKSLNRVFRNRYIKYKFNSSNGGLIPYFKILLYSDPNSNISDPNSNISDPNSNISDPNSNISDPNSNISDPNSNIINFSVLNNSSIMLEKIIKLNDLKLIDTLLKYIAIYDNVYYLNSVMKSYKYNLAMLCEYLITHNAIKCLKSIHINDIKLCNEICSYAAMFNAIDCLEYLYNSGSTIDNDTMYYALRYDSLECFKYLLTKGLNIPDDPYVKALNCNTIKCIEYMYNIGVPYDEYICEIAALHDSVSCIKFMCDRGFILTESVLICAMRIDSLECFKYVYDNLNIDINEIKDRLLMFSYSTSCINYIHENLL
jgi:hypothetical protein